MAKEEKMAVASKKPALTGMAAKINRAITGIKKREDYRGFSGDVKAQKVGDKSYAANSPEAKNAYFSRKYSGFTGKIRNNDTEENNKAAATIIKAFVALGDINKQKAAAEKTLAELWATFGGASGGARGPRVTNTPMTMSDLDF